MALNYFSFGASASFSFGFSWAVEGEAGAADAVLRREGGGDDHPERQDAHNAEDGYQNVRDDIDGDLGFVLFNAGCTHYVIGNPGLHSHFCYSFLR